MTSKRIIMWILLVTLGVGLVAKSTRANDECNPVVGWTTKCFENSAQGQKIKKGYIKNIRANRFGRSAIWLEDRLELIIVDNFGNIVVPNVFHAGDFDKLGEGHRLIRFSVPDTGFKEMQKGRCGYIDSSTLGIVVPASFDQCGSYVGGKAVACENCVKYCTEYPDCQDSVFIGGMSFVLNKTGKIVNKGPSHSLDTICGSPDKMSLREELGRKFIKCNPAQINPFQIGR